LWEGIRRSKSNLYLHEGGDKGADKNKDNNPDNDNSNAIKDADSNNLHQNLQLRTDQDVLDSQMGSGAC